MRILHLGKFFPPVPGGMERFLGDLVRAQRRAGHQVAVLVHDDGRRLPGGDPPWLLRCPVWLRLIFTPISPRYPAWLQQAVARLRPDVLHIHMPNVGPFWALMLPAARRCAWVIHWHADVEVSQRSLRLAYPFYALFEHAMLDRAEAIIVTSRRYLEASRALAEWRHKCHVVPLGVDPARLPEVAREATAGLWTAGRVRFLAVGRLTYYKGFDTLARAALGLPGAELVIVGEGEQRGELESILAAAGGAANVRLRGEVDDAALHALMASCDVVCLPSRERTEAFGIVLMEAMRYARPLLVSDLPGSGVMARTPWRCLPMTWTRGGAPWCRSRSRRPAVISSATWATGATCASSRSTAWSIASTRSIAWPCAPRAPKRARRRDTASPPRRTPCPALRAAGAACSS
jgi:glycosyltransferase involved in cell wall biosynthesis